MTKHSALAQVDNRLKYRKERTFEQHGLQHSEFK